jgi:hypothetical protein
MVADFFSITENMVGEGSKDKTGRHDADDGVV